ncbi:MAG: triphosphoribosyl-dephospho-CoA synthase [Firmicutes bacterium]|nr:triphosphoribosyl-dephospho-CoA synthase [Bacillota bacterium]
MSFAASRNSAELQGRLLDARERRQQTIQQALETARAAGFQSLIVLGGNVPGASKRPPGLALLMDRTWSALAGKLVHGPVLRFSDILGPCGMAVSALPPREAKAMAMTFETAHPSHRLLDLDVYALDGHQLDRRAMEAKPRLCLCCDQPAGECIRLQRHSALELQAALAKLLGDPLPSTLSLEKLPHALVEGARQELHLTPKPGLVDGRNNGSHPDLSMESMERSIALLLRYYEELQGCQGDLTQAMTYGQQAEGRMFDAIGANAHKGYLFLSGLLLLAALPTGGALPATRETLARLARACFQRSARRPQGEGIRREAEAGLPTLFEIAWPGYRAVREEQWPKTEARHYLMALLMQHVEDTTTLKRGGDAGLARLRADGLELQLLLESRQNYLGWLQDLDDDYRARNLTMGGVADCLALTLALEQAVHREQETTGWTG